MTTLEQAELRFTRALDRIEATLGRRAGARRSEEEAARLRADLARLREEHEALRAAARVVSGRLNGVAARVRAVLDEQA